MRLWFQKGEIEVSGGETLNPQKGLASGNPTMILSYQSSLENVDFFTFTGYNDAKRYSVGAVYF